MLAAGAIAVLIGTAVTAAVRGDGTTAPVARPTTASAPRSATPATPATAESSDAALAWARRSLSPHATIVSDRATVAALHAAGFASAVAYGNATSQLLHDADFMIDVAGMSDDASPTWRVLIGQSLPLAAFGSGSHSVTAREVFGPDLATIRTRILADAHLRQEAGRELLDNSALVPDAATRQLLATGAVDIRTATVLSELASIGRVYASDPIVDAAERRVGQPVRSLSVSSSDLRATQALLLSIAVPYRPDTVALVSPRKLRLTWMPAIAPAPTAGG